jgi:hypothetical protein
VAASAHVDVGADTQMDAPGGTHEYAGRVLLSQAGKRYRTTLPSTALAAGVTSQRLPSTTRLRFPEKGAR